MKTNNSDVLIKNIKHLIELTGVKQGFIAEKSGFTERAFSDILCKRKTFKAEYVIGISQALGVTPNDLFATDPQKSA